MLTTRESNVRHLGKQIKPSALLTTDSLSQQLPREVRGIHAMTGISLGVIHIRLILESPDLRQTVGANANHPAPLIVDLDPGQLRKNLQHLRPHVGGDVLRVAT